MTSHPGDMDDISNSPAYHFLDELAASSKLSQSAVTMYKSKYASLHDHVVGAYDREKQLLKKAKTLHQDLLAERISSEKLSIRRVEDAQLVADLQKEKDKAERELQAAQEKEGEAKWESEKAHEEERRLTADLNQMKSENDAVVRPAFDAVEKEVNALKNELARTEKGIKTMRSQEASHRKRMQHLGDTERQIDLDLSEAQQNLADVTGEPDRLRKSYTMAQRAIEAVKEEIEKHKQDLNAAEGESKLIEKEVQEATKDVEDQQGELERHLGKSAERSREIAALEKNIEREAFQESVHRAYRVEVDADLREAKSQLASMTQTLAVRNKEFEVAKRRLRGTQKQRDFARDSLPELEGTLVECRHTLRSHQRENKGLRQQLTALRKEVDALVAGYVHKEQVEKDQQGQLEESVRTRNAMEEKLEQWKLEERRLAQTVAAKTAARERQAREASKVQQKEADTRSQIQLRRLTILDLSKKSHETASKLKEFYALYEVVKNERNKYVNLIQAAQQALAEMREKIKILDNEVGILQSESGAKSNALQKETLAHATAVTQRNAQRNDVNRLHARYREKQEQVEQQIVQVDKLNAVINRMEAEMLRLKRKYEAGVEARNYTGIQLIDRNDDLCILYEKANVQEATLRQGTIQVEAREQEARMLNLTLAELQRQLEATRRVMPQMPQHAERVLKLQQELTAAKEETEKICRDLEAPQNLSRWRPLQGDDPTEEQLLAKVAVLEERLKGKKEGLVEKELVLEEVGSLTGKLRTQANAGRSDTLDLARQVNSYQARIREVTRKLMSAVSELSLYQATAMKLKQERDDLEQAFDDGQVRMSRGEAPSEYAEDEFYQRERERLRRRQEAMERAANPLPRDLATQQPAQVTRTTAEPRPNAYVPDDELGIPRPYGGHAPFKPTETGAQMRHIRKPEPRQVVI